MPEGKGSETRKTPDAAYVSADFITILDGTPYE
jgi:hypothetical protein